MRYMMMYRTDESKIEPPTPGKMARMGAFVEELQKSGTLLDTGGLQPSAAGARVRRENGTLTVTDGPFTEAKELIAGYAVIEARSKQKAIDLAKRFLHIAGDGESEIRPFYGA